MDNIFHGREEEKAFQRKDTSQIRQKPWIRGGRVSWHSILLSILVCTLLKNKYYASLIFVVSGTVIPKL